MASDLEISRPCLGMPFSGVFLFSGFEALTAAISRNLFKIRSKSLRSSGRHWWKKMEKSLGDILTVPSSVSKLEDEGASSMLFSTPLDASDLSLASFSF